MNIYEIKRRVINAPYFFNAKTMRGWGQTLKSFHVWKTVTPGIYHVWAISNAAGHQTERWFNANNNKLYTSIGRAIEDADAGARIGRTEKRLTEAF